MDGPKDYSWDNSGSKEHPWENEWDLGESSYVLPHETNKFPSTGGTSSPSPTEVFEETREDLVNRFIASHPVEVWEAIGLYDNSFLNSVHSHWLQFGPASPVTFPILCGIYCLIMTLGIGGNLLVILMFIRCRSLRTPPNYLIVNLAVSDFLMMIKMPIFIFNATYGGPALGIIGCKIYGYVGGLSGTASIMTLSAIAIDRYTVIAYPINPMNKTTSSKALWMVGAVWVYSILFSTLPFFGVSGYVAEGYLTSCSFDYLSTNTSDRVFIFIFFLGAFVFPLSLIVFSYVKIFRTVRSAEKFEVFNPKGRNGSVAPNRESFRCKHDSKKQKTEVKIAVLSSTIILVWLVAWTPYSVVSLMGIFGYKDLISPLGSAIPSLFCKTAGCIDPFLYAIKHPRFQRELKAKLPFCGSGLRNSSSYTSYNTNHILTTDDTSNRQGTSSPSFTHFETSRNRIDGSSLQNSSPHLTFDLREMKPLNASPPNALHSGTKKRLKSSLKRSRRRNERISSLETSDETDRACGTASSTSCPIPGEIIHLLCDETLNYRQDQSGSGDKVDSSNNKDALSHANELDIHKNYVSVDEMPRESKCGLLGKVEIDRITRDKAEIALYDDNDLVRNFSFKGYNNNSTKLWRSKSATLNSNYTRESVRESFQASTRTYCTLVVKTERKRSGLFPYISYETTLL